MMGNVLSPLKLIANVVQDVVSTQDNLPFYKRSERGRPKTAGENVVNDVTSAVRGKLAPQYGMTWDVLGKSDFMGRPLPNADPDVKAYAVAHNKSPYKDWGEYLRGHLMIPVSGGLKEFDDELKKQGLPDDKREAIVAGIVQFVIEATGTRLGKQGKPVDKGFIDAFKR